MKKTLPLIFSLFCISLQAQQTYSNSIVSTGTIAANGTVAPEGYTWAELQAYPDGSSANSVIQISYKDAPFTNYLADDFIVPAGQNWDISSIDFYSVSYDYNGTTLPFPGVFVELWNGDPQSASSVKIWGDQTTNILDAGSSPDIMCYATTNSLFPAQVPGLTPLTLEKRIWKLRATINHVLPAGHYWFKMSADNVAGLNGNSGLIFSKVIGDRGLPDWNGKFYSICCWADLSDHGNPTNFSNPVLLDFAFDVNYTGSLSVEDTNARPFALYPNPASTKCYLSFDDATRTPDRLEIYDVSGRLVLSINSIDSFQSGIDVSALRPAMYVVRVSENGKSVFTGKLSVTN